MKPLPPSSPSVVNNKAPGVKMVIPASIYNKYGNELSESQYYFIHLLVRKMLKNNKPLHAYHPLKITYLANQLGSKCRVRQIQKLIDLGIVAVQLNANGKETYEVGTRAKAYQITEPYRLDIKNDNFKGYYSKAGGPLAKRLRKLRLNQMVSSLNNYPILEREYNWLKRLVFDEAKARDFQDIFEQSGFRGEKPYTRQASLRLESDISILSHLGTGDFTFNYNGSRLTTSVCNAMKQMRECLMDSRGNYFVELDLRSSQLVFLCKALVVSHENDFTEDIKHHLEQYIEEDIDINTDSVGTYTDKAMFIKHVLYGDIYRELQINDNEYVEAWTSIDEETTSKGFITASNRRYDVIRSDYKKQVLQQVLFNYYNREKTIPRIAKAFSESYPSVEKFLMSVATESQSHRKSTDLANITQSYEGYFVNKLALDRLQADFPDREFYTVYDCIGVPEDIAEKALELLNTALERHLGISASLGIIRED